MFGTKVTEMSPLAGFVPAGRPANRGERLCATRNSMQRIVNGFLGILHGRAGVFMLSKRLGILGAFAILPAMAQAPAQPPSPTALYSFAGGSDGATPFAASENQKASCPTQVVTYQFSGQFGGTPIKGNDGLLGLAGEPFSITLYACESKQPFKTGPDDAIYSGIGLTATLDSYNYELPITIRPTAMTFGLVRPSEGSDAIEFEGNVPFACCGLYLRGTIALPVGTLASTGIAPFSQVSIVPAGSTFLYSLGAWQASHAYSVGRAITDPSGNEQLVTTAGTSGTTAPAWDDTVGGTTTDGTVVWTCEGAIVTELSVTGTASGTAGAPPAAKADAVLHPNAVQVITAHADGSRTLRPLHTAPVNLLVSSDKVMLQFYASGVRDASEAHVQIAGQDVPVLYSGASGHFPGLDEVIVEVPRSLAGMGQVDVVLKADGQTATPVPVHIQ